VLQSWLAGDIISVAIDCDGGTVTFLRYIVVIIVVVVIIIIINDIGRAQI